MPASTLTPTPSLPDAATTPTLPGTDACRNCGAERHGAYCHVCGQHYLEERLTARLLWREFAQRFLKLERGLGRTLLDLTRSPGAVARDYVAGRRRTYVNPISYFLLGAAATLLVFREDEMRTVMEEGMQRFPFLTPEQSTRFVELVLASISISYAYQLGFLVLAMALAWRVLFRKTEFTFVENTVPALYAVGHVSLFTAVLTVGELFGLYEIPMAIAFFFLPAALVWVGAGFFRGRKIWGAAKTVLAFVLAFAVFGLLRDGFLIALVLLGY